MSSFARGVSAFQRGNLLFACAVAISGSTQLVADDTSDGKERRTSGFNTVLLSDELPDLLGAFTKRHGVDYEFRRPVGADSDLIDPSELDPIAVIRTVRPMAYFSVHGPVVLLDKLDVKSGRADRAAAEALLVAGTGVLLSDGVEIGLGEKLFLGYTVERGLVLNAGDTDILLQTAPRGPATLLAPGEALIVLSQSGPGTAAASGCLTSCSTSCTSGYFACCNFPIICCSCKCVKNGTPVECSAGGEGSTSCSGGTAAP